MKRIVGFSLALSLFASSGLGFISSVFAQGVYQLFPMSASFTPSGSGVNRSFEINNLGKEPIAVEVYMTKREISLDGEETNPQADDDFLVYPPQMIVKPGQTQAIRVTWLGDPNPPSELAYRIVAAQVPIAGLGNQEEVPTTPGQADVLVEVFFRYMGSVYITPSQARPNVVLDSVNAQKGESGKDELVLVFENQGTAHKNLTELELTLTSAQGGTITLAKERLRGVIDENILPGNKRRFVLPWPKELPVGPVTATFTTN
jgi:fimbrial chaperone protein